nr:glycosyltransferase [Streptomyces europaeiscabiei]
MADRPWYDARRLDIDLLLWRLRDHPDLAAFVDRAIGPLRDHDDRAKPPLLPTLETYLAHAGRKAETARELHLNRQTLYNRLARIGELLGTDLDDPQAVLALSLALRADPCADPDRPASKIRAELGATDRPLLMAVGTLDRHRGYDTLLDAAREWRGLDPAPLLVVAGEGPLRSVLQRRIENEELPVRLVGRRDDVSELIAAADIALLPGGPEARSVLAQEALHARVPLVAAAVGSLPDLVGDGAELVPYGDAEGLATAVVRLLGDPARCETLRERGTRQAATWPTEDETVAQVLSVYDELTQLRPLT